MDRRSLPWKKKSSDKTASEKPAALIVESASAPSDSTEPKVDQIQLGISVFFSFFVVVIAIRLSNHNSL
ncbi:hypothetical protein T459_35814 [Capsicum annuum]|uniref:Uncharacterized protein n=1 Tax=Capsicum annuum TaxID=4072 RepID=A0A2G2UUS1_CAPAN|nr:hypothetical protein T459_35830 [Capsicum annuum]PHT24579.1 hypothetical protein T459_35814 [Capsicum annuum]